MSAPPLLVQPTACWPDQFWLADSHPRISLIPRTAWERGYPEMDQACNLEQASNDAKRCFNVGGVWNSKVDKIVSQK